MRLYTMVTMVRLPYADADPVVKAFMSRLFRTPVHPDYVSNPSAVVEDNLITSVQVKLRAGSGKDAMEGARQWVRCAGGEIISISVMAVDD